MIGYLEGRIIHFESDSILLLVDKVGYEILLSPQILSSLKSLPSEDDTVSLFIYYHQTERQPKPVLIGFKTLQDKEFFQTFITVDAIGPMKAVKALTCATGDIALAIEKKDTQFLTGLTGIGKRSAEKIIATLHGKVEKFVATDQMNPEEEQEPIKTPINDIGQQVVQVLVGQLGHSQLSAKRMVREAFERNPDIDTPEALLDEIYQESS